MNQTKSSQILKIYIKHRDFFNYALYQNGLLPLRGIEIKNNGDDSLENITLRITTESEYFNDYQTIIPLIPDKDSVLLEDPHLLVNGKALAELTEAENIDILVELCWNDDVLCSEQETMQVLPYDQWVDGTYSEYLASFVMPNHQLISSILYDASQILSSWNKNSSLEGYQSENPNRVRDILGAVFSAIKKRNIFYSNPPASFSISGQRIRTADIILEQKIATCMDMTLLYASCIEAIGLHPLLVMMEEHIYPGVWLRKRTADEIKKHDNLINSLDKLQTLSDNNELLFIESTCMCDSNAESFDQAENIATRIHLQNKDKFQYAIDIACSRIRGIHPMPYRMKSDGGYQLVISENEMSNIDSEAPFFKNLVISEQAKEGIRKIENKRDLWESKLLDLTQRNMLLNLRNNGNIEPIMSSHIDELEDALADGEEFRLLPKMESIAECYFITKDEDGKEIRHYWLEECIKNQSIFEINEWPEENEYNFGEKLRREYHSHRLYTFCSEKELEKSLTKIYRSAKSSQQENGVSSMYLAIGLLKWYSGKADNEASYAPLILLPVEIVRKSALQGFVLHARDDEAQFNTTLLELLKQEYDLDIPGLDPLPRDDHGYDIKKIFTMVRHAILPAKDWKVIESCAIGNFSFSQFAMWNDIHTAGDLLENSNVVRSLMKGHIDWNTEDCPQTDQKNYIPITVDGSQLNAIEMAVKGQSFVLHGPPGTGKSQTITGIISNLLAHGKRVLFVAEKMAALSVVQRRLEGLGIGDFCLELHSDKANKKQVLSKFEHVLELNKSDEDTEYDDYLRKTKDSRADLDNYVEHLHKIQSCGLSMYQLINLYESIEEEYKIPFEEEIVEGFTRVDLDSHIPLIKKFVTTTSILGEDINPILYSVGINNYTAEIRYGLKKALDSYLETLRKMQNIGEDTGKILSIDEVKSREDYKKIYRLIEIFEKVRECGRNYFNILDVPTIDAEEYFIYESQYKDQEKEILLNWEEKFLEMDMSGLLEEHTSAGKKFLRRSSAKAAITAKIQKYCKFNLEYEQIPEALERVIHFQKHKVSLSERYNQLSGEIRTLIRQYPDAETYKDNYHKAEELKRQVDKFPGGIDQIDFFTDEDKLLENFTSYKDCYQSLDELGNELNYLLMREERVSSDRWIEDEIIFANTIIENFSSLKDLAIYNEVVEECRLAGLGSVVEACEKGLAKDRIIEAYRKGLYYCLIEQIMNSDDILAQFKGLSFENSVKYFKELDGLLIEESKKEIFKKLVERIPGPMDGAETGKELTLLKKAIGNHGRNLSLRALFDMIPHILPAICPCMLMSPNSVAQYLAQENDLFDLVIFDEASQLPTCKSIGALYRAKNAVIVGDPKQMPPTTFFAGNGPEVNDLVLEDLDSILDDTIALGVPSQYLTWHYRSSHESLIAFSNHEFYENKMLTFPSANDREKHVTTVHVDGIYRNGTNLQEAEAIVEEILHRFKTPSLKNQSIGVVAFNIRQQGLIENLLEKEFQADSELDIWANSGENPVFVKNLENVQGDERDVILFSIAYGPDDAGKISMNFGPINQSGGGKRLNVAFSRSRVSMIIYTSMLSSDIRVTANSPEGIIAFRDFLAYADGHDFITEKHQGETEHDEGIAESICQMLKQNGYQYETRVGHSDFRLDIAVVDPAEPTKYILGILLDGKSYCETRNTKDREISQINVLKNLGWTIKRIWTIDWLEDRDRVINELIDYLQSLKTGNI